MRGEAAPDRIRRHDDRPLGVAMPRDQLRIGDRVDVVIEAQLLGQHTGVLLTFRNVVYQGVNQLRHQFDGLTDQHFFSDHEIVRVALCTN
jgi:hypothetical protein